MGNPTDTRGLVHRRIGPRSAGMSMRPDEFDALPPTAFDDRYRYEVIRGTLVVSPFPGNAESDPNDDLGHLLRTYQETDPRGHLLDRTIPERTVPGTPNRRRCDRAIWAGLGRLPDTDHDVPAIVVEFVSARKRDVFRDYEEKRDEYLAAGVREYWVIDRFRRTLTVYRPGLEGPDALVVTEDRTYESPLLPGFTLPLARLLAAADAWRKRRRNGPKKGTEP